MFSTRHSILKTQHFGNVTASIHRFCDLRHPTHVSYTVSALKDYRENRENGADQDNPKSPFPSAGFDTLAIETSVRKSAKAMRVWTSYDWPDKQGRYWWKLTLNDGRVVEDFYWTEDEVRGFPDKSNEDRYWFIVHHAPSGTKVEGFSLEPDYKNGCSDHGDNGYTITFCFTDTHCPAIRQWMEEKERNYLIRTIGDFLKILNKAPLFKALPDELQLIIFEWVVGGRVSLEVFESAKIDAERDKMQPALKKDVLSEEEIGTASSQLGNKTSNVLQPHHTRYGFTGGKHPQATLTDNEAEAIDDEAECSSTCAS